MEVGASLETSEANKKRIDRVNSRRRADRRIEEIFGSGFIISNYPGITNIYKTKGIFQKKVQEICSIDYMNGEVISYSYSFDSDFQEQIQKAYFSLAAYLDCDGIGRFGEVELRWECKFPNLEAVL
ncbi:MAG: hypothetical protein WDZ77_01560 [Candidatus Pacearchaeota archaeon]